MGCGASRVEPQPDKASAKAPPPSFAALIAAGTVVPDEHDGPYALSSYHANVTGRHRGYKAEAGYNAWFATNKAIMARQTSWATIDFEAEDAVDPEYMFDYGAINGVGVVMQELRPTVIEAQAEPYKTACCKLWPAAIDETSPAIKLSPAPVGFNA